MVQILWLVLGGTAFVAALFAGCRRRAMYVARAALGAPYLGAGALIMPSAPAVQEPAMVPSLMGPTRHLCNAAVLAHRVARH